MKEVKKNNFKTSLSRRQDIEKKYHNAKYKDSIQPIYSTGSAAAYKFYWKLMGDVNGLKVLDFGCGNGWLSILLTKHGAKMWGIDISEELIKKAVALAEKEGLQKEISFKEMAAENLDFKNDFFDLILGSAILHHTDIKFVLRNIYTVLKPYGKAIFIEPMNQSFFLKIWREITPWRRSPAERAFVYKDLKFIQGAFPNARFYFFGLVSIFSQGLLILSPGNRLLLFVNNLVERLDNLILRVFPFLGRYCAVVVMELVKNDMSELIKKTPEEHNERKTFSSERS